MRCSLELASLRACLDWPQRHAMARAALVVLLGGAAPGGSSGGARSGEGAVQPASPSAAAGTGRLSFGCQRLPVTVHSVQYSVQPHDASAAEVCLWKCEHSQLSWVCIKLNTQLGIAIHHSDGWLFATSGDKVAAWKCPHC